MSAAENQRDGRLVHSRDKLGESQPRFNIPADGVEDHQQSLDAGVLLDRNQLRNDMLIFCGLGLGRGIVMPLDLADDGQAVDGMAPLHRGYRAALLNLVVHLLLLVVHLALFAGAGLVAGCRDISLGCVFLLFSLIRHIRSS